VDVFDEKGSGGSTVRYPQFVTMNTVVGAEKKQIVMNGKKSGKAGSRQVDVFDHSSLCKAIGTPKLLAVFAVVRTEKQYAVHVCQWFGIRSARRVNIVYENGNLSEKHGRENDPEDKVQGFGLVHVRFIKMTFQGIFDILKHFAPKIETSRLF